MGPFVSWDECQVKHESLYHFKSHKIKDIVKNIIGESIEKFIASEAHKSEARTVLAGGFMELLEQVDRRMIKQNDNTQ